MSITAVRAVLALLLTSLSLPVWAENLTDPSNLSLRGQLVARQQSQLAAGMSGQITQLPVRVGDHVRKGQLLVQFDCSRRNASYSIARAQLDASKVQLKAQKNMLEYNSTSPLEVELTEAEVRVMEQQLQAARAERQLCQQKAPFDGLVSQRQSNPHQFVNTGEPLLELINPAALEVQFAVPSSWLRWLQPGMSLSLQLDELALHLDATISRLGGRIDPVSQTVDIYAALAHQDPRQRPGMSGTVQLSPPTP